jgi:hypothetical protein
MMLNILLVVAVLMLVSFAMMYLPWTLVIDSYPNFCTGVQPNLWNHRIADQNTNKRTFSETHSQAVQ